MDQPDGGGGVEPRAIVFEGIQMTHRWSFSSLHSWSFFSLHSIFKKQFQPTGHLARIG